MSVKSVSPKTLKSWLDDEKAIVIDVREPREYAAEHIEGSTLVPLRSLHPSALPDYSGQKLVMLCRVGNRSLLACRMLNEVISADIYNLEGGIHGWMQEGLPVRRLESSSGQEDGVPLAAKVMRFMTRFS